MKPIHKKIEQIKKAGYTFYYIDDYLHEIKKIKKDYEIVKIYKNSGKKYVLVDEISTFYLPNLSSKLLKTIL